VDCKKNLEGLMSWFRSKTKWGAILSGIGMFLRMAGIGGEEIAQVLDLITAILMGGGGTLTLVGLRDAISKNGVGN
jgi:hypothetical protein